MSLQVFSVDNDKVIHSFFVACRTTYDFSIKNIVPLIQKLDIQRKIQSKKFYSRLAEDIIKGCIMPPLTLAFIEDNGLKFKNKDNMFFEKYINSNINKGFVLDGIQRLTILKEASLNPNFNSKAPIFFNVLICPSYDKLLYRMITLNNGQKPMTMRHQIEILLGDRESFEGDGIKILSEREAVGKAARGSFKKSNFIDAYLAFISNTTDIDNKKIIESKLNELLASRIMESGASSTTVEFSDVISLVAKFSQDQSIQKWFKNENNLIGFSVAMRDSDIFNLIYNFNQVDFKKQAESFEEMFKCANVSQIRVSNYRRRMAFYYFKNLSTIIQEDMEPAEIFSWLSMKIEMFG